MGKISLRKAALISGIALLIMTVVTPYVEFSIFPKLVVSGNAEATTKNLIANGALFRLGIFCYLVNFICDMILAWSLYILLKPVSAELSLLAALFRLMYTAIGFAALLNLVTLSRLLDSPAYLHLLQSDQFYAQVALCIHAFKSGWAFAMIVFGIYLVLLGYLVFKSGYIPAWLGVLLSIAGLGWLADNLQPFLYPGFPINSTIIMFTGVFELVFMLWLLIRGWKIAEKVS